MNMIYLDYAADTPVCEEVLQTFEKANRGYFANPNSSHALGRKAKAYIEEMTESMALCLGIQPEEIIYTSGATEANNLAIKGVAEQYAKKGRHIITSYLEHSSVTAPLSYLQGKGYEVDFVNLLPDGRIDLDHLKELLRPDTILVSTAYVDSELGVIQDIESIGALLKEYSNCLFHVDATQAIGKIPLSMASIDLMTFTAHKLYGLHGIGVLIKKSNIYLSPVIHGGISTTIYRGGTPSLALICSMEKALALSLSHQKVNNEKVKQLNDQIRQQLIRYPEVMINSNECVASPYILNISLQGMKAPKMQTKLEEKQIYLSTKSACVTPNTPSRPVLAMTGNRKRALSTLRISLSHLTTVQEVQTFLETFQMCYEEIKLEG